MVSTYYIYYIVTTYYVINGITIIKYLHTVNPHNGGNDSYMSRPCATLKGVLWALHATVYGYAALFLYMALGNGFVQALAL